MSKRIPVNSHSSALKLLAKKNDSQLRIILENTPTLRRAIRNIFKKILSGKIKLKEAQLTKLKRHRAFIRKHAVKLIKVTQKGGSILRSILKTIVPLLPALL